VVQPRVYGHRHQASSERRKEGNGKLGTIERPDPDPVTSAKAESQETMGDPPDPVIELRVSDHT
jgi:hypothetical protein